MLVFVDESGDTGLGGNSSQSSHFFINAVIFQDPNEATDCSKEIDQLKKELKWLPEAEFKFSHLNKAKRLLFLNRVKKFKFLYCSIIINKGKLTGPGFKFRKSFYKYPAKLLFKNAQRFLKNADVIIDDSGDPEFNKQLCLYLKKHINDSETDTHIKDVRMASSDKENLLQLSDMVVGAIARQFKPEKADYYVYRPVLILKEVNPQIWPSGKRKFKKQPAAKP